jgi:molybdate transport system permease protein
MDWSPVLISLKTASAAILVTFVLGLLCARYIAFHRNQKFKTVMDGILTLPLVLPPTVVGFFLLLIFGVNRPFGHFLLATFGVTIVFHWWGTVIAAVVIAFPLMYRSARGALEQVDPNLIFAGRTLGMSENAIFWKIVTPAAKPGIISGAVLAFARGLGEFGATIMLAGNIGGLTRTLPISIYTDVASGNMDRAMGSVLIICVISFAMVLALNYYSVLSDPKKGGQPL